MKTSQALAPPGLLTLPGEQLLLFTRMHWSTPVQTIGITALMGFFLFLGSIALFFSFLPSPILLVLSIPVILLVGLTCVVKSLTSWYFNVYIVTNRRIAEICYLPLATHYVNEILLDQVNCTEVDVRREGVLNHLLDIGSVGVTFDRPTHQDEFMFWNVSDSRGIGSLLTNRFMLNGKNNTTGAIWYKDEEKEKSGFFVPKNIFPNTRLSV